MARLLDIVFDGLFDAAVASLSSLGKYGHSVLFPPQLRLRAHVCRQLRVHRVLPLSSLPHGLATLGSLSPVRAYGPTHVSRFRGRAWKVCHALELKVAWTALCIRSGFGLL